MDAQRWGGGTGVLEAEWLADDGLAPARVPSGAREGAALALTGAPISDQRPPMQTPAAGPLGATRRLSAIMFTDMVGYTKLVQEDERRARRDRDRWRCMLDLHARRHGGKTLQFYGDGALTVFDSAVAAVESAVAIQRDLLEEPRVLLRIGIHTGDVVYDEEGVFGDGVNVAARLQGLATPGAVLASGKVYDEIKNQPHLSAVSLGEFHLKNVQRPVRVFAMAADGVALPAAHAMQVRAPQAPASIAVLPFVSMSVDPSDEVFSDGMTEELINVLTRVDGLQVTARTSSFAFKGRQEDIRKIANELGVRMVLEGSVRRAASRVRVTAQLIDAASGYHLFSETYDRLLSDVFDLQDEIARKIVGAVEARLDPLRPYAAGWETAFGRLDTVLASRRTSTEAHEHYLRGLHEHNKWTPEAMGRCIEELDQCVALDPDYAPAHAALAWTHGYLASTGQAEAATAWRRSDEAARRAVELDPSLGEGHVAVAMGDLFYRWDVDGAYRHVQKALSLSPGSAIARQSFGIHLIVIGEAERAVEQMELATRFDPLSNRMLYSLAWALLEAERHEEVLDVCDRILASDPLFRAAHEGRGMALAGLGRLNEAAEELERVVTMTGDTHRWLGPRGYVAGISGRPEDARRFLRMIDERAARHPGRAVALERALVHLGTGDLDRALSDMEAAAHERLAGVLFSVNGVQWRALRADPRYWRLAERHGLGKLARGPAAASS